MIVETHIHLTHHQYDDDREQVIELAKQAGVSDIIDIGCDRDSIYQTIELGKKHSIISCAIGLHPVDVKQRTDKLIADIKKLATRENKVVAIGEIGLDYHWYPEEKNIQLQLFHEQMQIASDLKLPVIIHSRDAYEDCLDVIRQYPDVIGVIHSFSSDYESAKKFIELGYYIGIGGPVTFKNGHNQKQVVANIDLDYLVIETDGPYLTPVPFRGKRNQPSYLTYILEEIATIRNQDIKEVEKKIYNNSLRLFKEENE